MAHWRTIEWRNSFETRQSLYLMAVGPQSTFYYARGVNREQVAVWTRLWHRPVFSISVSCQWRANGLQLARFLIWFWLPTTDLTIKSRDSGYESKFKPSNSIARSVLLQKCFAISFSLVYARSNPVSLHFLHSLYLFFLLL